MATCSTTFQNFFRQCREPSRFGFYRIAADQVDSLLGVMKDLLQHPYQNKDILAPHKVDTFPYQMQAEEEKKEKKEEQGETQKQENMEQKQEKHRKSLRPDKATSPLTRVQSTGRN